MTMTNQRPYRLVSCCCSQSENPGKPHNPYKDFLFHNSIQEKKSVLRDLKEGLYKILQKLSTSMSDTRIESNVAIQSYMNY